jgi:opacity protein-like surface antigen
MKLKKILLASAATATLAVAGASAANAAEAYASIFGGLSMLQNSNMKGHAHTEYPGGSYTLLSSSSISADTSFKTGFVVGGNFGIDWQNGFRAELELAMRRASSDSKIHLHTTYNYGLRYAGNTYTYATNDKSGMTPADINMRAYSLMANAWYDFDIGMPITPYVGGGIGMALVQMDGHLTSLNTGTSYNLHEKNDTVFAWQLGVGASYPLSDHTKLTLDYRYFAADGAKLKIEPGFQDGSVKADFDSSDVMIGLRFSW